MERPPSLAPGFSSKRGDRNVGQRVDGPRIERIVRITADGLQGARSMGKTDNDQDVWPESLGELFVMLKTFVDARTISKFTILGSDYQKTLHKHVEPSNLPVEYGGTGLLGVSKLSDLHSIANGYEVFGTAKTFVREQKGRPHAGSKKEKRRAPRAKQDVGRVISAGTDDADKAGKSMGTWIDHKSQKATSNPLFTLK